MVTAPVFVLYINPILLWILRIVVVEIMVVIVVSIELAVHAEEKAAHARPYTDAELGEE